MEYPAGLTPVHFIRLELTRRATGLVSEQFLPARRRKKTTTAAIRDLPKVDRRRPPPPRSGAATPGS